MWPKGIWAFAIITLVSPVSHAAPAPDPVPPDVRKAARAVLNWHVSPYRLPAGEWPDDNPERWGPQFDAALARLKERLNPEIVTRLARVEGDVEARVALIAWDREANPHRYRDLLDAFRTDLRRSRGFHPDRGSPHVINAPVPRDEHLKPEYRLAWEYMLLTPLEIDSQRLEETALAALTQLPGDESLPTLVFYHQSHCTANEELVLYAQTWLSRALNAIKRHPSEKRFLALLGCTAYNSRQWANLSSAKMRRWPEAALREMVLEGKNATAWKEIMQKIQASALPPDQRELLERLRKAK